MRFFTDFASGTGTNTTRGRAVWSPVAEIQLKPRSSSTTVQPSTSAHQRARPFASAASTTISVSTAGTPTDLLRPGLGGRVQRISHQRSLVGRARSGAAGRVVEHRPLVRQTVVAAVPRIGARD